MKYLQDTIVDMCLSYAPLDSLKTTILELKRDRKLHLLILKLLDDLSTHSAVQVRRNVATLTGVSSTCNGHWNNVSIYMPSTSCLVEFTDKWSHRSNYMYSTQKHCIVCVEMNWVYIHV